MNPNAPILIGGELQVSSGGTADAVSGFVISGGPLSNQSLTLSSGDVAVDLTVAGNAFLYVESGGVTLGGVLSGGEEIVSAGGYASGLLVLYNSLVVEGGGSAVGATVQGGASIYGGGVISVLSGGLIASSVVSSGGRLLLENDDQVAAVTVSSGGELDLSFLIDPGIGSASFTVPSNPMSGSATIDGATVLAGGTIIYGDAEDAGLVTLPAGALASTVSVDPGATLEGAGAIVGTPTTFYGPDPNQVGGLISGVNVGAGFDPGFVTVSGSSGSAANVTIRNGALTISQGLDGRLGSVGGAVVDAGGLLVIPVGGIANGVILNHGGEIEFFNVSATSVQLSGSQIEVFSGGVVVDTVGLAGNLSALQLTSSVVDGFYGVYSTYVTATQADVRADFEGGGVSDILIENTAGAVVVGQAGAGLQESYLPIAGLGPEWSILGAGDFLGSGQPDFLMERTANGALVVGAVAGGQTTYTGIGALAAGSNVAAVLDNLGEGGQSAFLVEAANGALQLAAVIRSNLDYTPLGGLGPEWKFVGAGDFLGDGGSDFLIENTSGAVVVGEVSYQSLAGDYTGTMTPLTSFDTAKVAYTRVAGLGPEWSIVESGDFLGNGRTDFLMENTSGALAVGEVGAGEQATYTTLGGLGPEWSFVGAGDYFGTGKDGFLIENTSGVVVEGGIAAGHVTYAQVGALGPEWKFHT